MNRFLTILAAFWLLAAGASARDIEATLIRASNETSPSDARLKEIQPKLKKVFGYAHYRQLGQDKKTIPASGEFSLNIGEGFTLFLRPKTGPDNKTTFDAEMYSGKTLIVKQEKLTMTNKGRVFIRGPEVGNTLLIVALTVHE